MRCLNGHILFFILLMFMKEKWAFSFQRNKAFLLWWIFLIWCCIRVLFFFIFILMSIGILSWHSVPWGTKLWVQILWIVVVRVNRVDSIKFNRQRAGVRELKVFPLDDLGLLFLNSNWFDFLNLRRRYHWLTIFLIININLLQDPLSSTY